MNHLSVFQIINNRGVSRSTLIAFYQSAMPNFFLIIKRIYIMKYECTQFQNKTGKNTANTYDSLTHSIGEGGLDSNYNLVQSLFVDIQASESGAITFSHDQSNPTRAC